MQVGVGAERGGNLHKSNSAALLKGSVCFLVFLKPVCGVIMFDRGISIKTSLNVQKLIYPQA